MIVLGLSCSFSRVEEEFIPNLPNWFGHDSAAVLMEDGEVIAAIEEERLNRLKHTNKFPAHAVATCLARRNLRLNQVDRVAYSFEEEDNDKELGILYSQSTDTPVAHSRELIVRCLGESADESFDSDRIRFVHHHTTHAHATYYHSGFVESLIAVIDGSGERESTSLYSAREGRIELLKTFPISKSLGHLYSASIELLGYTKFDEYKVMGLAPHGDAARYRRLFAECYQLVDDGDYELDFAAVRSLFLRRGFRPRRRGEPFVNEHRDFAAGLQAMLEDIVLHILRFARRISKHSHLCLAGGVGLNCSMNGKILRAGLFDNFFVHPASHDAGAALGAAMFVCGRESPATFRPKKLQNIFWGPETEDPTSLRTLFSLWREFIEVHESSNVFHEVAKLLRDGAVIAWVQGRSEFGPRALGNRSILADPRPEHNRTRINAIVKKRESYRPFAPSVLAEYAGLYFDIPVDISLLEFMIVVVDVKPEYRGQLAAVTHVDGTARIHCVTRAANDKFWSLLDAFRQCTGLPVLLNTSFNNFAEPIVQDVSDSVQSFMTTDLDLLVVDNFIVRRRVVPWTHLLDLVPTIHPAARLQNTKAHVHSPEIFEIYFTNTGGHRKKVTSAAFQFLCRVNGKASLREIGLTKECHLQEFRELWEHRFLRLGPPGVSAQPGRSAG